MGEKRNAYGGLEGKVEEKRSRQTHSRYEMLTLKFIFKK
jgi:hypothetical protein